MALKKVGANAVKGDMFSMNIPGMHEIVYREGIKTLRIPIEPLTGGIDMIVYIQSAITWEISGSSEPVAEAEKGAIAKNVEASLKILGISFYFNSP